MKRKPEETKRLRERAYSLFAKNVSANKIAEIIGVSERMVYRYIDAERLIIAEKQVDQMRRAMSLLDADTKHKLRIALRKCE